MKPLTNDELKELRTLYQGGEETALEWRAAVLAAHPFLLDEVERWRVAGGTPISDEQIEAICKSDALRAALRDSVIRKLGDEVERSRALLRRIEWVEHGLPHKHYGGYCPACGAWSGLTDPAFPEDAGTGHKPGCELAALLG